jgi:hypothetical protein
MISLVRAMDGLATMGFITIRGIRIFTETTTLLSVGTTSIETVITEVENGTTEKETLREHAIRIPEAAPLLKNQIRRVLEANFRIQQEEQPVQQNTQELKKRLALTRTTANVAAQKPTVRHQRITRVARRTPQTTKLRVKAIAAQTGALRTVTAPRDQVALLGPAVPLLEEGRQPILKSLFTNKHIRYEKSNSNPSVFNKHTPLLRTILVL